VSARRSAVPIASCLVACVLAASLATPLEAKPAQSYSLGTRAAAKDVQVTLDTKRFKDEGVATMRITNRLPVTIRGVVPACDTTFESKDARYSPIRPKESGRFVVGPKQTVEITRPFLVMDPKKLPPDGSATYVLNDDLAVYPGCRN